MEGGSTLSDCDFEAMLDQCRVRDPQMVCRSKHKITRVCVNPKCKVSLMCSEQECSHCGNNVHRLCSLIPLSNFTKVLNDKISAYKEFAFNIYEMDSQLTAVIHKSGKEIMNNRVQALLKKKGGEVIREVYKNKNAYYLTGEKAKQFYQTIREEDSNMKDNMTQLLKKYRAEVDQIALQITSLKRFLVEGFCSQLDIESNILSKENYLVFEQLDYLKKILNQPKKITLLYRASENNFRAEAFHKNCDGVADTVTIVKTESGKIIGGYSKYPWSSYEGQVNNEQKETFLFSLSLKEKMSPVTENSLIYNKRQCGPIFGRYPNGTDLYLSDQCNIESKSDSFFPSVYNSDGFTHYDNSEETTKRFIGSSNDKKFIVIEYEVFQVTFN